MTARQKLEPQLACSRKLSTGGGQKAVLSSSLAASAGLSYATLCLWLFPVRQIWHRTLHGAKGMCVDEQVRHACKISPCRQCYNKRQSIAVMGRVMCLPLTTCSKSMPDLSSDLEAPPMEAYTQPHTDIPTKEPSKNAGTPRGVIPNR